MSKFQVGDIVRAPGFGEGIIEELDLEGVPDYPISVRFYFMEPNSSNDIFTIEGKLNTSHPEPMLELVKRPKKKWIKRWVNLYYKSYMSPDFCIDTGAVYKTKKDAEKLGKAEGMYIKTVEVDLEVDNDQTF
jgi:hypothetical protein